MGVLMALSMLTAVFGRGITSPLRHMALVLIAPLGDGGMYVVTSLKSGAAGDRPELSPAEVRRLQQENEDLRWQLAAMERQFARERAENQERLAAIQRFRASFVPGEDLPCELIPARVVAADALPYSQGRAVNRGTYSGAAAGAPVVSRLLVTDRSKEMPRKLAVVTASALVGCLESAGKFSARLQLVTDPGFRVQARVLRRIDPNVPRWVRVLKPGAAAEEPLTARNNVPVPVLAVGDGAGGLTAEASEQENILPGDWLVTSGDDEHLRTEVPIGVVEEVRVRPEDHRFVKVRVRPFEDLAALRDVFIVYWKPS